ncbi:MAG: hypothetical protein WBF08_07225 [Candidatus Bathyarchaeia archaeon]
MDFGISSAVTIAVVSIILILLWVSFNAAKNTSSGRYWILIWIPMGWLVSLSLAELLSQTIFQSQRSIIAGWHTPHVILWSIAFFMLLLGFLPQFRPKNRTDRINLLIFIICWTVIMVLINLFWFRLIFV